MKHRRLLYKINMAIVTTAVIVCLFFGVILYPLEIRRQNDQIRRIHLLLDTVFKQKRNDLANELFAKQKRALEATLAEIEAVEGIIGIGVFEKTKEPLLTSNNRFEFYYPGDMLDDDKKNTRFERITLDGHPLGVYTSAIEVIGKRIGYVVIYYDFLKIEQDSRQTVITIISLLVATVFLMAILLNMFLHRSVIKPVSKLRNAMRIVGEGRLGETVNLSVKDEIGEMGVVFNNMSITLRSGRQALIEAEEKYRGIFENAIEGIFQCTTGREAKFTTVNSSMATTLGYSSPEELIGAVKKIGSQLFANRNDWRQFEEMLMEKGRIVGQEAELITKDHHYIWASISARQVLDDNQKCIFYEGSFVDITEHRQKEIAERQRERAEAASKAKSEFLATMSHEIRTPLNVILGFADILDSETINSRLSGYIQNIKSSGDNLLQLINDILDLSKIEAGRMELQYSAVNLKQLVDEVRNLFSVIANQKLLDLRVSFPIDRPPLLLLDRRRLRQILFNLVGNAVKFTNEGFVEIHVETRSGEREGKLDIQVDVRDSGPGIHPESLKTIFDPFQQEQIKGIAEPEGSGLGLSISKSFVETMGGNLEVISNLGQGSTFSIFLPGIESVDGQEAELEEVSNLNSTITEMVFDPATLLVVDDLEVNRELLMEAFKNQSHIRFLEADNGRLAVSMALKHKPDLIVMDIRMPDIDGYQAIKDIRHHEEISKIPVIAITAAGMEEDIKRLSTSGFDAHLIRPFGKSKLFAILSRFLNVKFQYDPKTTISKDNEKSPIKNGMDKTWTCPKMVADLLKNEFTTEWISIKKKQRIPDIKQFSTRIQSLGEQYNIAVLTAYGDSLRSCSENINIEQIQKILTGFSRLLENMKPIP